MKKVTVCLVCILLLLVTGCNSDEINMDEVNSDEINSSNKNIDNEDKIMSSYNTAEYFDDVHYEEGIYDKGWGRAVGNLDRICIPNKDKAIKIACSIFENFQKEGEFKNYVVQEVLFDTQEKIWIVSFWAKHDETVIAVGGGLSIVLRADNAQVIKTISGE